MSHANLSAEQSGVSSSTEPSVDAANTLAAMCSGDALPLGPRVVIAQRCVSDILAVFKVLRPNGVCPDEDAVFEMVSTRIKTLGSAALSALDDDIDDVDSILERAFPDQEAMRDQVLAVLDRPVSVRDARPHAEAGGVPQ